MKKKPSRKSPRPRSRDRDTMRPEYDFSKGVRNKYAARLKPGSQIIVLDPDVAAAFGDAKAVNKALRTLLEVMPSRRSQSSRRRTAQQAHAAGGRFSSKQRRIVRSQRSRRS